MSLRKRVAERLAQLPQGVARQDDPAATVWRLADPPLIGRHRRSRSESVEQARRELLAVLLTVPVDLFITHGDSPESQGVPGRWVSAAQHQWRVPAQVDVSEPVTSYWLFTLGNWTIYAAPAAVQGTWPDPFRSRPADLVQWLADREVEVLISAFPDSTEWVVALGREHPPGGVARR